MISERIELLRKEMATEQIDLYIVPTADFHQSEYVGEYFKCREYLTGFTGSAGTAVITPEEAGLWTDGRYFLQADQELAGTGIRLQKSGEPGVPTIEEYLETWCCSEKKQAVTIGFDGRCVSLSAGERYAEIAEKAGGQVRYDLDLMGNIWKERPAPSQNPIFPLDLCYAGESTADKMQRLRERMRKLGVESCIITGLDDIGWLLNLRGNDVAYCPLFLAYLIVNEVGAELYVDEEKCSMQIREMLLQNQIQIHPYDSIYRHVKRLESGKHILVDPRQINYALYSSIPADTQVTKQQSPVITMKSIKNATEIRNIREAHRKDAVACTKFMYWLKQYIGKERITEISASEKLEQLRAEQEHFLGPSFEPICAYKEHGAIVHYSATPDTDKELQPEGMILCDTGGHYLEGSTDITRTIVLGEVTAEEKAHFTTVLCAMLNLANARFLYGCTGMSLDYAAREPFWRQNLNYNHGTGHGVGYLGNIHEPPARFFWKPASGEQEEIPVLEPGMIITDEPGIYIEGSHGIRIENELLICTGEANEYGRFLHFEPLTFVPVDLDAICTELMDEREKKLLNQYHAAVRKKIMPYLNSEEQEWLNEYTRPI